MNIFNVSEAVVEKAVPITKGDSLKPFADRKRGAVVQPLDSVGSEDVTIRRTPDNSPKLASTGMSKVSSTAGWSSVHVKHVVAGLMLIGMVGCGTTTGDRAISGAGIGAGAGAVLGTVTGMGPGTGAAIGAAAGAATGGLTKKKQINLGKPIWR